MQYLDTSAAVKLVVEEPESAALRQWLERLGEPVSSDLLRTELQRAVRRAAPELMPLARAVLDTIVLQRLGPSTFERAGTLSPESLRSLDALHLASALELADGLDHFVTYDDRLARAASLQGLNVITPT